MREIAMVTVTGLFVLIALCLAVWSAGGKFPAWPSIVVLCLVELLQIWPR